MLNRYKGSIAAQLGLVYDTSRYVSGARMVL